MKFTIDQSRDWYNNLPGKKVSSALIIRVGDEVLMIKEDYKPFWNFPTGVVDQDEDPFTAALRETKEEVGLTVASHDAEFFSVAYVPKRHGFHDRIHFFFITTCIKKDAPIVTEPSVENYAWVAIDAIDTLVNNRQEYLELQKILLSNTIKPFFKAQSDE